MHIFFQQLYSKWQDKSRWIANCLNQLIVKRQNVFVLVLANLILVGCAMVASDKFDTRSTVAGCDTNSGAYYLPTSVVSIAVQQDGADVVLQAISQKSIADRKHAYCLDFLASPTSDDTYFVQTTDEGLLIKVSTDAEDKSTEIVKTIAKTVIEGFKIAGGFRSGGKARLKQPFSAEFDPFDLHQTALINDAINDFQLCILLEDTPGISTLKNVDTYCDNPLASLGNRQKAMAAAFENTLQPAPVSFDGGILYRPRMPYNLYVFVKQNRLHPGGWQLRQSKIVRLENRSPVLAIGVDRTFFATRRTRLMFDKGSLTNVIIQKDSELKNIVTIPLEIVQNIIKLPAEIIQIKIGQTESRQGLITAQANLINAYTQLQAAQNAANVQKTNGAVKKDDGKDSLKHIHADLADQNCVHSCKTDNGCKDRCLMDGPVIQACNTGDQNECRKATDGFYSRTKKTPL